MLYTEGVLVVVVLVLVVLNPKDHPGIVRENESQVINNKSWSSDNSLMIGTT